MGGNSILAIKLVTTIIKKTSLILNIADIFTHKNIKNIAHYLQNNTIIDIIIPLSNISKVEKQVLSFAQERLFFIDKYEQGTNAYNIPMLYKLNDNINIQSLQEAIHSILKRHEILRTSIKHDNNGNNYQFIHNFNTNYFEIKNITTIEQFNKLANKDINYIFNLNDEYPIKVKIFKLKNTIDIYISIVIHHIAFDGWSADIFLNELQQYYNQYLNNTKLDLPSLTIQYKDFALWQRHYLTGKVLLTQLNYWKKKLDNYENINLLTDYSRPLKLDYKGNSIPFTLNKKLSNNLRNTAKRLGVTLYTLLLSSYYLMLRSYTNQDDIVIGTPVANRHYHQTQYLIGFFVNTVALRINIHNSSKLTDFIKQLGDQVIEAQIHQDLPFEKLVDELNVEKDTSRHPIFQVMFGLQSFGNNNIDKENNILLPYEDKNIQYNIAKFDIETFIDDSEDILRGAFNYRVTLYKKNTIKGFINTYIQILQQIADIDKNNENFSLQNLKYLSTKEEELILKTWNDTDKEYPHDKTIHSLFEDQVLKTPNNIAVIYENIKLTYIQLNDRANQLAYYLIKHHNIKPDTLIALLLDRSEHMLITILAVLKAGAAYVPMDPNYPDDRIKYILSDTNTTLVIANNIYTKRIKKLKKVNVIPIDDNTFLKEINTYSSINTRVKELTSSNLAYVIYTSGTTGNPKGVMIEHKGIVNFTKAQSKEFTLFQDKNNLKGIKYCLSYANYVFDAYVSEIFTCISNGHAICIPNNNVKYNIDLLAIYIKNYNINIATLPPALLKERIIALDLEFLY